MNVSTILVLVRTICAGLNAPTKFLAPVMYAAVCIAVYLAGAALCPTYLRAETLLEHTDGELRFALLEEGARYRLTISPKDGIESLKTDLTANAFYIPNPPRLVIDIPNIVLKSSRALPIQSSAVTAMRVGIHSNKTRLVLDLRINDPSYNVRPDPTIGALVVDFGPAGASAPEQNAPAELPEKPAKLPEKAELPDFVNDIPPEAPPTIRTPPEPVEEAPPTPVDLARTERPEPPQPVRTLEQPARTTEKQPPPQPAAEEPPTTPDQNRAPYVIKEDKVLSSPEGSLAATAIERPPVVPGVTQGGGTTIKGIFYQASKNSNESSVMLDVESLRTYSLSQREPNVYELVLENARLAGDHLTLPQFPPDTFKGFEVLLATQRGDDVIVKIYVEDGVKLTPFIQSGQLWLKTIR